METYCMSNKQINQLEIIKQIEAKKISQKYGAEILALSTRQLRRKLQRYKAEGINSLQHKSKGRSSSNKLDLTVENEIIKIVSEKYLDYGPTLIAERLTEKHNINVDHETVRRILIKHDLWKVQTKRKKKMHVWRERKHCEGEMVQADGSRHQWLTEDYVDLLSIIDDATGKIYIKFASESVVGFSAFFREFIEENGIPQRFYCDKGKVFKVNKQKSSTNAITQFERMLKELNVKQIHAQSPQAKGRVERLFRTLQDRLLKELRENNIKTIEDANKYVKESNFIKRFNDKFSIEAKSEAIVYQSANNFDLKSIFCKKYYRTISNDYTIQFKQNWYQLGKKQPVKLQIGTKIEVRIEFDGTIGLFKDNNRLNSKPIEKGSIKPKKIEKDWIDELSNYKYYSKPAPNHPWRNGPKKSEKADISAELKRGHFR